MIQVFFISRYLKKADVTVFLIARVITEKVEFLPIKGHLSKRSTSSTGFSYFYITEGGLKQARDNFTVRRECVTL